MKETLSTAKISNFIIFVCLLFFEEVGDDLIHWSMLPLGRLVSIALMIKLEILFVVVKILDCLLRRSSIEQLIQYSEFGSLQFLLTFNEIYPFCVIMLLFILLYKFALLLVFIIPLLILNFLACLWHALASE